MSITLPQQVRLASDVIFQEIAGECVVLNMASEQYFGFDDVGTRIWQLLIEHGHTDTVLAQLQAYYEADVDTLRRDLAGFIQKLHEDGLVQVEAPAADSPGSRLKPS